MWRLSIGRRLLLLIFAIGLSVSFSFVAIGPSPKDGFTTVDTESDVNDPIIKRNIIKHLLVRYELSATPASTKLVWDEHTALSVLHQGRVWFSAKKADSGSNDIFSTTFSVSAKGIPVAMSQPANFTRTDHGDDLLLDAGQDRILYGVRVDGRYDRVVTLSFGVNLEPEGLDSTLLGSLGALAEYRMWQRPERVDAVLTNPAKALRGSLGRGGFSCEVDGESVQVGYRDGTVEPNGAAVLLMGAGQTAAKSETVAGILQKTSVFGQSRLVRLTALTHGIRDWLQQGLHWVLPRATERLPAADPGHAPRPGVLWPPPNIPVRARSRLPGEGQWAIPAHFESQKEPPVRETFIRPDRHRPYERVWLYAFDMRRLGLGYVAGTEEPRPSTGLRGDGLMPPSRRKHVVAMLSGGLAANLNPGGRVTSGRVLLPPKKGLATLTLEADGKPGFGLWDAEGLTAPWVTMIQNLGPLVVRGHVSANATNRWGQSIADLDMHHVPRTGMGVTEAGVVIFAWSQSTSAPKLGEAMKRAGVGFAMHLGVNEDDSGIRFFDHGVAPEMGMNAHPGMNLDKRSWLHIARDEYFYFYETGRLAQFMEAVREKPMPDVQWAPIQFLEGVPLIAKSKWSADVLGTDGSVTVYALSAELIRPHLVPGVAEKRPGPIDSRRKLDLPAPPLLAMGIGLRATGSPFGMTVERRVWSRARKGAMTMVVDANGEATVGRFGEGQVDARIRWSALIQGPALLENRRIADGAQGVTGKPTVGLGTTKDGLLVMVVSAIGERRALAMSLKRMKVDNGLVLGEVGTVDTGRLRLFFERQKAPGQSELFMLDGLRPSLLPAQTRPGAGSALYLTARRPKPSARVLSTFIRAGRQTSESP